jgi:hypothetical protein
VILDVPNRFTKAAALGSLVARLISTGEDIVFNALEDLLVFGKLYAGI